MFNSVDVANRSTFSLILGDVRVLFVSVSVVAFPTRVSVASGNVTVRSSVGSPTTSVVSYESATAPSNTMLASDKYNPEIVGLVKVLFVSVFVESSNTTVPVASGNVIVLSAVGSVNTTVVSFVLSVTPSIINPGPRINAFPLASISTSPPLIPTLDVST